MSESIGLLSFSTDPNQDFQPKPYSRYLQNLMDNEAQQLVATAYKTAEKLIIENKDKLEKVRWLLRSALHPYSCYYSKIIVRQS